MFPLSASPDLFPFPLPPQASEGEGEGVGGCRLLDADGHVGPGHREHRAWDTNYKAIKLQTQARKNLKKVLQ